MKKKEFWIVYLKNNENKVDMDSNFNYVSDDTSWVISFCDANTDFTYTSIEYRDGKLLQAARGD